MRGVFSFISTRYSAVSKLQGDTCKKIQIKLFVTCGGMQGGVAELAYAKGLKP